MDEFELPADEGDVVRELAILAHVETHQIQTNEERVNPFRLIGLKELLSRPPKPYLVAQWFGFSDHCMIYGDSGCGKTFLVIDLIVRGALGLPIADHFELARPFASLYCSEEGNPGIPQRFDAAARHHGLNPDSDEASRIGHFELVPKLFYEDSTEEGLDDFIEAVKGSGFAPDIIVFDTLADVSEGSNENDNGHIATINRRTRRVREALECTTIFLHHTPKNDPTSARGGGGSKGKADLMVLVEGKDELRSVQCMKAKDGVKFKSLSWKLESFENSAVVQWLGSDRPTPKKSLKMNNIAEIVQVLRTKACSEDRALRPEQVHALLEAPPTSRVVADYLKELRNEDTTVIKGKQVQVLDKNGKRNNHAYVYWFDGVLDDQ